MKSKFLLLVLSYIVCLTATAQSFKTTRKFDVSVYNAKDSVFTDTTATVLIEVENGKLKKLCLFPLGNDKSVTYKHVQLQQKTLDVDYEALEENFQYVRKKFAEWSLQAKSEGTKKLVRKFEFPKPFPKFQGKFRFAGHEWYNDSFDFVPTFFVTNGVPYVGIVVKTLSVYKAYDISRHGIIGGVVHGLSNKGVDKTNISSFYLWFSKAEQLDSFMECIEY